MLGPFQHMVLALQSSLREEKRWGPTKAHVSLVGRNAGGLPGPGPARVPGAGARRYWAIDSGPFIRWWGQQAPMPPMAVTNAPSSQAHGLICGTWSLGAGPTCLWPPPPGFQKVLREEGVALLNFLQDYLTLQGATCCPSQTYVQGPLGRSDRLPHAPQICATGHPICSKLSTADSKST